MFSKYKYHGILRFNFIQCGILFSTIHAYFRYLFILFSAVLNSTVFSLPQPPFLFCQNLTFWQKTNRHLPGFQDFSDRFHIIITAENCPSAQQFPWLHIRSAPKYLPLRFQRKHIIIFQKNRTLTCQRKRGFLCLSRQRFFSLHSCKWIFKQAKPILHHQHIPCTFVYQRSWNTPFFNQFFQMEHICRTHHVNVNSRTDCGLCGLFLAWHYILFLQLPYGSPIWNHSATETHFFPESAFKQFLVSTDRSAVNCIKRCHHHCRICMHCHTEWFEILFPEGSLWYFHIIVFSSRIHCTITCKML